MAAVTVAFALALAGCGGGSGNSAAGPATPAASAIATTPTEAAAPDAPKESAVKPEDNPPGDIPDNLAFVKYRNAAGGYSFTHPEGWARTVKGTTVNFTDKLNGVTVELRQTSAPTVASAKQVDVPELRRTQAAFELKSVSAVKLGAGSGVKIVYRRNSAPDPVTGREYRDEIERYEIWVGDHELVMELYGPVGADNVDAYRVMLDSLTAR
ncbi:MAG TPA: hypothetical protein VMZ00_01280 [Sporichthya sp.]|nr:hypothetical protein [Sporichthya sp.]